MKISLEQVAQIVHGAMVELRIVIGQNSTLYEVENNQKWEDLSESRRKGFIHGVRKTVEYVKSRGALLTPHDCHLMWMEYMIKEGWKYGEKFDLNLKLHPNLVPVSELPVTELWKDALFISIVSVFAEQVELS